MVQCLRLCAANAGGLGLISGQETKISHAVRHRQKIKKKVRKTSVPSFDGLRRMATSFPPNSKGKPWFGAKMPVECPSLAYSNQ